jgi:hypothetical protein
MKFLSIYFALFSIIFVSGFVSRNSHILDSGESQLQTRAIQTRVFDTNDKKMVTRNVVATLQDLNFVIDDADAELGTVSATKLSRYQVKITVQVRPKSDTQMIVRANARYNLEQIDDPQIYQDFFSALGKSLFLTANAID